MTIDDESSVYVGGLPSATTEDTVRRVFDLYGAVVAVKIVCDRATRGNCYGFVTFTNPRSALDAINDMNGRSIEGQIVKVSEVTTRGGKSKIGRNRFRHIGLHKGRDQERKDDHYRGRFWDQNRDRPSECTPQYKDKIRRGYEHVHVHDHDTSRQHFLNRIQDKVLDENEQGRHRSVDLDSEKRVELERIQDKDIGGVNSKNVHEDKNHLSRKRLGATINDKHTWELSSNSSDGDEVKEQLDRSIRRHEELNQEVSQMEVQLNEKQLLVSELQKRSKKLEDALVNAKKLSSHRQKQLIKLYNCFTEVKTYTEKIKSSEQELQSIVDAVQGESGMGNDL